MLPLPLYIFILIELIFVSWIDYKTKKISNVWFLINMAFFLALLVVAPDLYSWQRETFFFPLGFLCFGFLAYLIGIAGAGDVKYLVSFFLLIPLSLQHSFFEFLLYSTIVVALGQLAFHTAKHFLLVKSALLLRDFSFVKGVYGTKICYAPIIAFAWICFGYSQFL